MGFWLSSKGRDHVPSSVAWREIIDECYERNYFPVKRYEELLSADGGKVSKTLTRKIIIAAKSVRKSAQGGDDYLARFDETIKWLEQVQEDGFVVS